MRRIFGRRGAAPTAAMVTVGVLAALIMSASAFGASAAPPPGPVIDIGTATSEVLANIEIIGATGRSVGDTPPEAPAPPATSEPMYVPTSLFVNTTWTVEAATVPDRTTNAAVNRVTPRTGAMVDAAISFGLTRLGSVSCVGVRPENPTSDHPAGRGCDLFFNPRSGADVAAGWRTANWLVANQAALGVRYVIWQGQIWNARTKPGPWTEYVSSAYGCPNPANLTGCHYDHVHVSMY